MIRGTEEDFHLVGYRLHFTPMSSLAKNYPPDSEQITHKMGPILKKWVVNSTKMHIVVDEAASIRLFRPLVQSVLIPALLSSHSIQEVKRRVMTSNYSLFVFSPLDTQIPHIFFLFLLPKCRQNAQTTHFSKIHSIQFPPL